MNFIALFFIHLVTYGTVYFVSDGRAAGSMEIWQLLVFALLLIWVSVVDIQRFEVPDAAVVLLLVSGSAYRLFGGADPDVRMLTGVLIWPVLFLSVSLAFRWFRGFDGLGFGDVKLALGLSVWLGFAGMTLTVLVAAVSGIFVFLGYLTLKGSETVKPTETVLAFAPFLCLPAWAVMLRGLSL